MTYKHDAEGNVVRITWLDQLEKHHKFDEYWEKHNKLMWWLCYRAAKTFGGKSSDYIGFIVIRLNYSLKHYDEQRKFSTYFCRNFFGDIYRYVLRYESDYWALSFVKNCKKEITAEIKYNSDQDSIWYRIPEKDDQFDELRKCFNTTDRLWRFLCNGLSQRSVDFLLLRYRDDLSLEGIGKKYQISKERTRQVIERALGHIKDRIGSLDRWIKLFKVEDEELSDHYFIEPQLEDQPKRKSSGHKKHGVPTVKEQIKKKREQQERREVAIANQPLSLVEIRELTKTYNFNSSWEDGILTIFKEEQPVLNRYMSSEDAKDLCERLGVK